MREGHAEAKIIELARPPMNKRDIGETRQQRHIPDASFDNSAIFLSLSFIIFFFLLQESPLPLRLFSSEITRLLAVELNLHSRKHEIMRAHSLVSGSKQFIGIKKRTRALCIKQIFQEEKPGNNGKT